MEQDQPEKVTKEVNEIITKNGDTEKLTIGEDKCEIPPGMKEVQLYGVRFNFTNGSRCLLEERFGEKFESEAIRECLGTIPDARKHWYRTFVPIGFPFDNYVLALFESQKTATKVANYYKRLTNHTITIDGLHNVIFHVQKSLVKRRELISLSRSEERKNPGFGPKYPTGTIRPHEIGSTFNPFCLSYNASGILSYPIVINGVITKIDEHNRALLASYIYELSKNGYLGTLTVVDPKLCEELQQRIPTELMPYSCLLDRPAYLGVTVALFLWSEDFLKQHYLPVMRDHKGKFIWIPPPKHSSHVSQHETIHPRQTVDYHGCYVFHAILRLLGLSLITSARVNQWLDVARRAVNDEFYLSTKPGERMKLVQTLREKKWKPFFE